jgi:hypothetical protein
LERAGEACRIGGLKAHFNGVEGMANLEAKLAYILHILDVLGHVVKLNVEA